MELKFDEIVEDLKDSTPTFIFISLVVCKYCMV